VQRNFSTCTARTFTVVVRPLRSYLLYDFSKFWVLFYEPRLKYWIDGVKNKPKVLILRPYFWENHQLILIYFYHFFRVDFFSYEMDPTYCWGIICTQCNMKVSQYPISLLIIADHRPLKPTFDRNFQRYEWLWDPGTSVSTLQQTEAITFEKIGEIALAVETLKTESHQLQKKQLAVPSHQVAVNSVR
jgi:hypothetical protein